MRLCKLSAKNAVLYVVIGLIAGLANGFFGGGGGIIIVPALVYLLKYEQKQAQATAIAIVLPLCVASSITYLVKGVFDLMPTLVVGGGVVIGGVLGAFLLKKLSNRIIAYIFYLLMLAAGIKLIIGFFI